PAEILHSPQQRLAAVQDDGELRERVSDDVLLDASQQLIEHLDAHQLGLVVDGGVAEPVAVGAIDIAARGDLYEQLRDRLAGERGDSRGVGAHARPAAGGLVISAEGALAKAAGAGGGCLAKGSAAASLDETGSAKCDFGCGGLVHPLAGNLV